MIIFKIWIYLCIGLAVYMLIGAIFWASLDDAENTLLKQAKADGVNIPTMLMAMWPLFLAVWIKDRRVNDES